MSKKDELGVLLECQDPDIVIGTETWLKKETKKSEFLPSTYEVYRNDRPDGYGGVFIAIKKNISSSRITPEFSTIDYVAYKINLSNHLL